jgi:putative endonuclease
MLRFADGSYCVGSARLGLERRVSEHNNGVYGGYTSKRRPVERRIKGRSRSKKEALIRGGEIQKLAKRRT